TLFMENVPISEATRGVVAVLHAFGLDAFATTLQPAREFFRDQKLDDYIPKVFRLAGIDSVVMTNDPLDTAEAPSWIGEFEGDPRFRAALRLDRIVNEWPIHCEAIRSHGYDVHLDGNGKTLAEVRRVVEDWAARMKPEYMAVSLPDSFRFPDFDLRTKLLRDAILPACRDLNIPLALMIGVRRQVNPALRLAGDAAGRADLCAVETLCREFPENRFLVSVLSRENQHELCVVARKFRNLMPFGCWWFLNNLSIVSEITRERLELLGPSFIPQHSDARVLEQLLYKWAHARSVIAESLCEGYERLLADGRRVTQAEMERDVARLFAGNFKQTVGITEPALEQVTV